MVEIQKPGARFILSAKDWKDQYDRSPKTNARPVVILQPFGPVAYLFDVGDTVPIHPEAELFPPELSRPYDGDPTQDVSETIRNRILQNLTFHGIAFQKMRTAPVFSGKIQTGGNIAITIPICKTASLSWMPNYTLAVRDGSSPVEEFSAIIHELAHFFCRHLPYTYKDKDKKWETRSILTHQSKEFEAETTSWLVCQRLGIKDTRSYAYLVPYLKNNGDIPDIGMDAILCAVRSIEQMLRGQFSYSNGYLYKFDSNFREAANDVHKAAKKVHDGQQSTHKSGENGLEQMTLHF